MQQFIGTKRIKAQPMTRQQYNDFRGWKLPENENGEDAGYLVEYLDGGTPNTAEYSGYVSWSPYEVFHNAYKSTDAMSFGDALVFLKAGFRVARQGWNGKGMWIVYMSPMLLPPFNTQGTEKKVNDRTAKWIGEDTPLETLGYLAMWTADKKWLPGWLASQTDMLAEDWMIIE